jgi:hypothetical protein
MSTRANIVIDQGTNFVTQINLNDSSGNPVDLSSYTINSQIRKTYNSISAYSFTASANSSGVIVLQLTGNTSASIPAGRYLYDVKATDNYGNASRIMEGQVTINPQVSRS